MAEGSKRRARTVWSTLREKGTATKDVAAELRVGIDEYLSAFTAEYLGEDGLHQGLKLVLGQNGEGKTHLLYSIRESALRNGHLCAYMEAGSSGIADTPLQFAREVLRNLESPVALEGESDLNRILVLLQDAIQRKRAQLVADGLDPEELLPLWARELRTKDLPPHGFAQVLSEAILALLQQDVDGALAQVPKLLLEDVKLSKDRQQIEGLNLLRTIARLPRVLAFQPLVLLIDEAENALDKAGSKRKALFVKFLRFLNDHLAFGNAPALVLIGCTDDFWPGEFRSYSALESRLKDPGHDRPDDRRGLSMLSLTRMNKLWVRETFQGSEDDFVKLGDSILRIAADCLSTLDEVTQRSNARRLARAASSQGVNRHVKRIFIKALAQLIDEQSTTGRAEVITEEEANKRFGLAVRVIAQVDAGVPS